MFGGFWRALRTTQQLQFVRCALLKQHMYMCTSHYENVPMQYTEILKVVKNENFQ